MKFKVLPEPGDDLERVAEMQAAVPLVPDEETSCCARLMRKTGVPAQDQAKEWLTFLRALRLVAEEGGQYRRLPAAADPEELREAFLERIYLAEDVLDVLADADEPLAVETVFERVADRLPQWEQLRHTDPETVWRERVRRLLEWAVAFGLATRADGDGYEVADDDWDIEGDDGGTADGYDGGVDGDDDTAGGDDTADGDSDDTAGGDSDDTAGGDDVAH